MNRVDVQVILKEVEQLLAQAGPLPDEAERVEDEEVIVQDIEIKPHNIRFQRSVYHSAIKEKFFRVPLPSGYDVGDFGADLRALVLSLKYCGNMSEPKIGEFPQNLDVRISAGSLSNILTNTASLFEEEFHDLFTAGLASTPYQQTDDTSARVAGKFWHAHIVCNPYYTAFFTQPRKDRLTVLEVPQNTGELRVQLGDEALQLLRAEFNIPAKWQRELEQLGEVECGRTSLMLLLDDWFGNRNKQLRTAIEHEAAKKEELLTVLDRPEVPLHNNAAELGARRRDMSLHSKSKRGARAMDIFTTPVQTCKKLGISAYAYLSDRLTHRYAMPSLAASIRTAASV